jgi:hypothetical protein
MTFFSRLGEKKAESLFSNLKGWEKFFCGWETKILVDFIQTCFFPSLLQ